MFYLLNLNYLFHLFYNLGYYVENLTLTYGSWAILGLFGFVIVPIILMAFNAIATYNNTFVNSFKLSGLLAIKHYFPYVLFTLIAIVFGMGFYVMGLFVHYFICIGVMVVIILYLLPMYLLANDLYCISVFDSEINKNKYTEIYRKGLSPEEDNEE